MPIARTELELKLLGALQRISRYQSVERLRRDAHHVGLHPGEHVEMAYENVLAEAKAAVKGVRAAPAANYP